ncbi:ubiquinol-cytochrome c reductase complex subunit [Diplocarpon mali]|nr:ubiquinol-cytochrome c reductase complex subunit [Diplocarpon mali]
MGLFDSFSDLLEAALPWSSAEAEAPQKDEEEDVKDDSVKSEEAEGVSKDETEEEEEEEKEEEEEEEMVDPKEKFEEERVVGGQHCSERIEGTLATMQTNADRFIGMLLARQHVQIYQCICEDRHRRSEVCHDKFGIKKRSTPASAMFRLRDMTHAQPNECKESKTCSGPKHHFDECVERVTGADHSKADKKHPDEDCVEEFFHLAHCASACAAPKLWATLK